NDSGKNSYLFIVQFAEGQLMYNSFLNHFTQLSHYTFAIILLYVLVPKLVFGRHGRWGLDLVVANYLKMVFLMILLGYALVAIKIWEALTIIVIFFLAIIVIIRRDLKDYYRDDQTVMAASIYGWIENVDLFKQYLKSKISKRLLDWKIALYNRITKKTFWLLLVGFGIVFGLSAYIRFYDVFHFAAPSMSDAYVTLAWMKYIDNRELFYDGIYPQGSHIYLDSLLKFSAIDPLYILKYTGPLNTLLIVFSLYFSVSRFTGNRVSALIAATGYGIFGHLILGSVWERQAATNSQEFAFIFILPSLYFMYLYLKGGKKDDLWTAAAGVAVTGLVHTLAFALTGMGIMILLVVFLFTRYRIMLQRVWKGVMYSAMSVIVALLPLGLGILLGKSVHQSSASYLTSEIDHVGFDVMLLDTTLFDIILLLFLLAITLLGIISILFFSKHDHPHMYIFVGLFGLATFLLYLFGGDLTHNELIATRSNELWALVLPFCIGIGSAVVFIAFKKMRIVPIILFISVLSIGLYKYPVEAITPYKMQMEEDVVQYLSIADQYRYATWTIVSFSDGYALVLNNGYHMLTDKFLDDYDPTLPPLTKYGDKDINTGISNDVFIYYYKNVFKVDEDNVIYNLMDPIYREREQQMVQLDKWIEQFQKLNGPLNVFYDGLNLRIYHIHRELDQEEIMKNIWG
ncbi:MAG: hypothetical protein WD424_03740, partial [Paenibacillaceae bacterium]